MLVKKTTKKLKKKAPSLQVALRDDQSRRDKLVAHSTESVKHTETFLAVATGDRASKEVPVVGVVSIMELEGVAPFVESKRSSLVDSSKRSVVDVKKLNVECVNASTNGPVVVVVQFGLQSRRTIIPVNGKTVVSFPPTSSINGEAEVTCLIPRYAGSGAEVWFVIKCGVGVRFVY